MEETMSLTRTLATGVLVTAALALGNPATAQQLDTSKPIRMIVGLTAGGGTDVTARLVAQQTRTRPVAISFLPAGRS
jgi:tripartite-type tricarboxylate transporter receptor subunit TctC